MRRDHDEKPSPTLDRYRDNMLIEACGAILSPTEIAKGLVHLPPRPSPNDLALPAHVLAHAPQALRSMHIPTAAGLALAQSIDIMIRQGYVDRNPTAATTWQRIYDVPRFANPNAMVAPGATVVGPSGTGKSSAIQQALNLKPQLVVHERFPHLVGPVRQLIWLKIDVPSSGSLKDLVRAFAHAADRVLGTDYEDRLGKGRDSADSMARRWLTLIGSHFLGLLVLDELQNLFKIETKAARRERSTDRGRPLLRIKDDDALKFILTVMNGSRIPVLACSTPDGIQAIGTRTAALQRLVTNGRHYIAHAATPDDEFFRKMFFPHLSRYQWLPERLPDTPDVRSTFHRLTGGIARIGVTLWAQANQRAIMRGAHGLTLEDLHFTGLDTLAPLQPAIQALLSEDPNRLMLYEDLLPRAAGV